MKYILTLIIAPLISAAPVTLEWADNSDNESGFEMRGRLPDGTWEVVAKTPPNVSSTVVDSDTHEAWQVFAFNGWGHSGGSNILERGAKPDAPGSLQLKPTEPKPVSYKDELEDYRRFVQGQLREVESS